MSAAWSAQDAVLSETCPACDAPPNRLCDPVEGRTNWRLGCHGERFAAAGATARRRAREREERIKRLRCAR